MKNILKFVVFSLILLPISGNSAQIELPDISLNEWVSLAENGVEDVEIYNISENQSLPFLTYYLELNNSSDLPEFEITINKIESFEDQVNFMIQDIPTSEDNLYSDIQSSASLDSVGFKPIIFHDPVFINERLFIRLQVFPITESETGQLVKNSDFQIELKTEQILQSSLFTKKQFNSLFNSSYKSNNLNTSSAGVEYLIVTNQELSEAFAELANYKNQTGISTEITLIEDILAVSSGRDDAEKLRNYLKDFYTSGGMYVLLGGDETIVPIRYAYHNVAYSDVSIEEQQVSDLYYADLTGDWNLDNDNIWGEKYSDGVDLTPELYVGRLPFNGLDEVSNYISKLINYETNRNNTNLEYLENVFIFSSDQMRDYEVTGQHNYLSEAFPLNFSIDTTNGIEQASGEDLNPTNLQAGELESILSSGYGIVNIIAHGSNSTFAVKTSGYNDWPKSYFTTDTNYYGHGHFNSLAKNGNISFYASLGCDNGAFDKDQPPFNQTVPNVVQTLLGLENSGAVGFIANSRWGWVSTSYLLQKRIFDYIINNPELPACDAMYKMKDDYYYYRDLILGINYFGDPTLKIYTTVPKSIEFAVNHSKSALGFTLSSNGQPLDSVKIVISQDNQILSQYITDMNTTSEIEYDFEYGLDYVISAIKHGYTIKQIQYSPSIVTDVNVDELGLPNEFSLSQNYPNPFNPSTSIEFSLPKNGHVSLVVYNTLGQEVSIIADRTFSAGYHSVEWNGKNQNGDEIASGMYFYRIQHEQFTDTKKMLLIR